MLKGPAGLTSSQAMLGAFPHIAPLSNVFFSLFGLLGLVNACLLMLLGLWTPRNAGQTAMQLLANA